MVTGSFASSYHGLPRATQDIDLVVNGAPERILDAVRRLVDAGFYVSEDAAREAIQSRGQFNVIDSERGWKIDLILRKDRPFSRAEFARREVLDDVFGAPVFMTTAEDLVLAKLEWARMGDSERQLRDVVGILRAQGDRLDRIHIEEWARELGVTAEWELASSEALG